MGLFSVSLECQPKMKNWIYHHPVGFLNYTSALINSAILLGLPNAPQKPLSKLLTSIRSAVKTGFRVTLTLAIQGVV
jgi:hypothetical protein